MKLPVNEPVRTWEVSGYLAISLLMLMTLLAYANAWPDVLVHDDKFFAGTPRTAEWADIPRFFTEDLWAAAGAESGLYRPVLLLSLALESRIHGNWFAGYHLDNILLHLLVTLVVYGFLRQVARFTSDAGASTDLYPLLAALVFAVHPVHTEVVNSIFNRSEMLVALAGVGGLWWFLHFLEARRVWAWSGLALCYLFALFSKESAIVIPAIAVALVLILLPGSWASRMRQCLPVLWLLLPLAVYLFLRAQALAFPVAEGVEGVDGVARTAAMVGKARLPDFEKFLEAIAIWGQALWLMVWPDPLLLYRSGPTVTQQWISLAFQLVLLVTALLQFRVQRYALLAALVFFYIAFLPASRIVGMGDGSPHLAERYLYFPSVGLAILLVSGVRALGRLHGPWFAVIPAFITLALFTPLTWNRNGDWASEVRLFESEHRLGDGRTQALRLLTAAYIRTGQADRAAEICDTHTFTRRGRSKYANHCAIAYAQLGRDTDAEGAYLAAIQGGNVQPAMYANLARFYLRQGRRQEAIRQFERTIEAEDIPALRAYRRGEMLVQLYPRNRQKLLEARNHFAEALRLQPRLAAAQVWLDRLDRVLRKRTRTGAIR